MPSNIFEKGCGTPALQPDGINYFGAQQQERCLTKVSKIVLEIILGHVPSWQGQSDHSGNPENHLSRLQGPTMDLTKLVIFDLPKGYAGHLVIAADKWTLGSSPLFLAVHGTISAQHPKVL